MARPTKFSQQLVDDYLRARRRGGNDTDCAWAAGVHPETIRVWRRRLQNNTLKGSPSLQLLRAFFDADKKAQSDARLLRLAQIEQAAASGKWQAAAWWLERKYPDEFAIRQKVEVTHISEDAVDAEIQRLLREMEDA